MRMYKRPSVERKASGVMIVTCPDCGEHIIVEPMTQDYRLIECEKCLYSYTIAR